MVSEKSLISNCITCFVSFGIRDYSFMLLEDYAFHFLYGCWNYVLIKTDIDVMMLFKFEFKYVKLNFKAIDQWNSVLISFSDYHVRMLVVCSRKTIENCLRNFLEIRVSQVSINRESLSIDQVKLWSDLFKQIDFRLLVNRSNLFFDRSRGNQVSFEQVRQSGLNFLIFSIDRGTHSINRNLGIHKFFLSVFTCIKSKAMCN